ncbi:PQQ-binding-like beta-propeller repeat protein [Streptomyces sp. NPDC046685]|uniref:PQQ-binding-like beta-propeller repeat protein n=1 Tax=Streptomyces sp. NPDC046685 TaxID=3157202 RepID=UPI0033EFDC54
MNPNHHAKKQAKELTRHNGLSYAANLAQVVREMTAVGAAQSAGPYSTGGGGIVLEHRFGAVLLSHLLTGRPVPALGDHITPTHVRFQGHAISRVDDILVRGRSSAGAEHLLSVGVRRRPRLVASDAKSVQLVEAFLDVVISQWPLLRSGRRRLALAVVPACRPAHQLADLAVVAAAAPSAGEFRRRMAQGGHASKEVRDRLVQLDALVAAALPAGRANGQTCWQSAFTGELIGRPAAGHHSLYLTTADGVIALDTGTGRDRWRTAPGAFGRVAAAAHADAGVVYVGLWQPRCLIALDADTGAELWRKKTAGSFTSAPFTASGIVYGGHRGGVLHGWNARSQREVWRAEVMWDEARQGGPLLVDGRAYVTGSNGRIHALALHT